MSHSRKHMTREALSAFPLPVDKERIARVVELRGSNICEIQYDDNERVLCQIPTRFRKLIWIKRGNFVIVKQPPNITNYKVRALVEHVLFPDQIKHIKAQKLWPNEFQDELPEAKKDSIPSRSGDEDESNGTDDDEDLFVNSNRVTVSESSSDEEDDRFAEEGATLKP